MKNGAIQVYLVSMVSLLLEPSAAVACATQAKAATPGAWVQFQKSYISSTKPSSLFAAPLFFATMSVPPVLPHLGGSGAMSAWGGSDPVRWRPEAILANSVSEALNLAWAEADVRDVIVAAPTKFYDSGFRPYGDGQSNAKASFESWNQSRPPVLATLVKFKSNSMKVSFRFDRAMKLTQTLVEIGFLSSGQWTSVKVPAWRDPNSGDLSAAWEQIPSELGWETMAHNTAVLVRPSPGYTDWFPITFRHPVKPIKDLVATVPAHQRQFSDGKPIVDAEGVVFKTGDSRSPFAKLIAHQFPFRYNQTPYIPANIHAEFGSGGAVTGVGRGWTWVAEQDAPFKIMYTCFERRQPQAEAAARDRGVASGGGWHQVGDNAETILNSLENEPLVVASGFANASGRTGLNPPSGTQISYGLTDVAVVRWLWPDEAFITVKTVNEPNFHWYMFQQSREVCTEEWVHPCRPIGDDPDFRCK